ncbi:MAG: helix-turn-helix transcriptional regulator [bacterium]|nr:helix-turn-helix transcriptional regulator [bacterium]
MFDNLNTDIGSRIRSLRTEKKLTRERLAEKAEISTQFLADLESGYKGMSAATLYKLSKALCVSSDYLLFGNKNNECDITDILNSIPDNKKESAKHLLTVFADAVNS